MLRAAPVHETGPVAEIQEQGSPSPDVGGGACRTAFSASADGCGRTVVQPQKYGLFATYVSGVWFPPRVMLPVRLFPVMFHEWAWLSLM